MVQPEKRRDVAVNKELLAVEKQERNLERAAQEMKLAAWKAELEDQIPERIHIGLNGVFCKGFLLVLDKGRIIIEKSYNREKIQLDHSIRDFAVQVKGGRKELRNMQKGAKQSVLVNLTVTTVEGISLGALGIGMPDIVLFLGVLLKAVYETSLNYGFEYESRHEQMLILKMMEASLSSGEDWTRRNAEVDAMFLADVAEITEDDFHHQVMDTASVFATDMLLLKFIQGLPVIGILGGVANPVYYNKIMKYVQLKYRKRYLLKKRNKATVEISGGTGN